MLKNVLKIMFGPRKLNKKTELLSGYRGYIPLDTPMKTSNKSYQGRYSEQSAHIKNIGFLTRRK